MSGLETGAAPKSAASDYKVQGDGGVVYTGAPEDFSRDMAAAVAQGMELGSMPAPTGPVEDVTAEKAAQRRRANPAALEKGAGPEVDV